MESYTIQKVDTNLYIKGFSGTLVFSAAYGIAGALLLFVLLYILAGAIPAVVASTVTFFSWLYRLARIQKKYGPAGWAKRKTAKQLPGFITIKQRIGTHENHESKIH
jgi:hypothetical protein